MRWNIRPRRVVLAGLAGLTVVTSLVACSSSGGNGGSGGSGGSSGSSSSAATFNAAQVNQIIANASKPVTAWTGPTSSPKPAAGKKIFILSVTQAAPNVVLTTNAMAEAAKKIGWTTTVYDGQATIVRYASGLETALSEKYDGVVLIGIPPTLVASQVAAIRAAGMPIVDISNATPPSATGINANVSDNFPLNAQIAAAQVAQLSNGKAHVALLDINELSGVTTFNSAFQSNLKTLCPNCKVVDQVSETVAILGTPGIISDFTAHLASHPDATYLVSGLESAGISWSTALAQTGNASKFHIVINEQSPQTASLVKSGQIAGSVAVPYEWQGYASIDAMNRLLHGETTLPDSVTHTSPARLFTTDNIPASQTWWSGDYDFKTKYDQLWGVG